MAFMKRIVLAAFFIAMTAVGCGAGTKDSKVEILQVFGHRTDAYTQGLFFWNGQMYETTGQYGESSIRKVDLSTGKVLSKVSLTEKYFAEGSCVVDGMLYVLTWKNRLAFVYDPKTLKYVRTLSYPRDGWGLTAVPPDFARKNDMPETVMVSSDGSSRLFFLDRELRTLKTLNVTIKGRPVRLLNELEWIDGKIWANVYTTDLIVVIDPVTGIVEEKIDCSSLIPEKERSAHMDVLNGIAQGPDGSVYLTGKYWPKLFKISRK